MIEVLAILGGSTTLGALALVAYLVVKLVGGKDAQLADRTKALEQEERGDRLLAERDALTAQLAAKTATAADLLLAKSLVESERNALNAKVQALETKLLAALPVGAEGAAIVNTQLSTPILEETPGNGLEKP